MKNTSRILCTFCCTFYCIKSLYILLEVLLHFPEIFLCMQVKLELFSPEIVSALQILSYFRIYRKNAASADRPHLLHDGGPLYTGPLIVFLW